MLNVGIFTGYYPYDTDEVIRRAAQGGFNCVQLDVSFKDCDAAKGELTRDKAAAIRDKLRDANLPAVCVSGYTNFIHPDPDRRQKNIDYLKTMIRFTRDLGCGYAASETGTYNEASDWVWDSRNASEEVYQETLAVVKDIVAFAGENGVVFLIENYVNNVIGTVAQVKRLFADVDSPNLGLICDPTNYFDDGNIGRMDEILREIFDELAPFMKIAHAKDCRLAADQSEKHADIDADESHTFRGAGGVELPAPGLGILNYPLYLKLLAKHHPNIPIIIEHLEEDDIPRAKAFVDDMLKKAGA
jgi:sugar phosphate isomerase/epimerase